VNLTKIVWKVRNFAEIGGMKQKLEIGDMQYASLT